ncbi:MAG: NYN domain-containing protein [Moorea sp. SIO2B7]|nr:NYN domain-containing protein [Moorena sp. SIO2B7]
MTVAFCLLPFAFCPQVALYWAKSNGFLVVTKEGKSKGDNFEPDVDIVMTMDALELSLEIRPYIVVLLTEDSDFVQVSEDGKVELCKINAV